MYRFTLALMALLCSFSPLEAGTVYILVDGDCVDRIRYQQAIGGQARTDYYAYNFKVGNRSRVLMETGMEGNETLQTIPQSTITCGDARLNEQLVRRVGNGLDKVVLLRPNLTGQYTAHPVLSAGVLKKEGTLMSYESRQTSFRINEHDAVIGENITHRRPDVKVIFEGKEHGACSGAYLFRQSDAAGSNADGFYRVSPDFGLLERRLPSSKMKSSGGTVKIHAINGVPYQTYLAKNCDALRDVLKPGYQPIVKGLPVPTVSPSPISLVTPSTRAIEPTVAPVPPVNPGVPSVTTSTSPPATTVTTRPGVTTFVTTTRPEAIESVQAPAAPVTPTDHVVVKGETLYTLSRKYDISANDLRAWNGVKGNTIYPGQKLKIAAPKPAAAPAPEMMSPAPAVQSAPATVSTSVGKTHRVKAGETVAYLAMVNGYTEARFRKINNLGDQDVLYVGQEVIRDHCVCPATPATTFQATSPEAVMLPDTGPEAIAPQNFEPKAYAPQVTASQAPAPTPRASVGGVPEKAAPVPSTPQPGAVVPFRRRREVVPPDPNILLQNAPATTTMSGLESRGTRAPVPQPFDPRPSSPPTQPTVEDDPFSGVPLNKVVPSVPNPTDVAPAAAPLENRQTHTVLEGETLYDIAVRYRTTAKRIRELNGLREREVPVPFQRLYVN